MNENYLFLKDELALIEIRKHRWIESEKLGKEIGFATAAVDWIKKYGEAWKNHRLSKAGDDTMFEECRKHRRFRAHIPVHLQAGKLGFNSHTNDISLMGVSCTIGRLLPPNTETSVELNLEERGVTLKKLQFKSRIARIARSSKDPAALSYDIYVPFDEKIRNFIRTNTGIIKKRSAQF